MAEVAVGGWGVIGVGRGGLGTRASVSPQHKGAGARLALLLVPHLHLHCLLAHGRMEQEVP